MNGSHQGTATHWLVTESLGMGNNRLLYSPDGRSLYTGKTHLSWSGREGIKRITYNSKPYLQAESVKLTPKGFNFRFNSALSIPADTKAYAIESYRIAYHGDYGSKNYDLGTEPCANVTAQGNELVIELEKKLKSNRVYGITLVSRSEQEA